MQLNFILFETFILDTWNTGLPVVTSFFILQGLFLMIVTVKDYFNSGERISSRNYKFTCISAFISREFM